MFHLDEIGIGPLRKIVVRRNIDKHGPFLADQNRWQDQQ
jgi:hypothetical protein